MDNITMSLGIYFEVKDAEIYGGEGMAQFCHVPVEKVRVISRDEYEENTDE